MRSKILIRILMATALLVVAIPVVASAQIYNREYDRSYDRDRYDQRDLRNVFARLDNASARLESDLNVGRNRRVLGGLFSFRDVDTNAIAQVRDFRQAVRELRRNARSGYSLENSRDEARMVIEQGVRLDRNLRLRSGSANVDADFADIRSNLNLLANAYGLSLRYY
ncbi:MAG TPA: hypothetical protein VN696_09415 [Pyrinomonadaceae bacterium]|nr:hypothetical protein [Pyrinomonadaceae bacterium]